MSAFGKHSGLTVSSKIRQQFSGFQIGHHGTDRKTQRYVIRCLAITIGSTAFFAVTCAVNTRIAKLYQRVDVTVGEGKDRAAIAAISSVGTSTGDEFLPPEAGDAVSALTGMHFDDGFVDEFHDELATLDQLHMLDG